jgi:hypothetical protein
LKDIIETDQRTYKEKAARERAKFRFAHRFLHYSQKNSTTSVAPARDWPNAIQP